MPVVVVPFDAQKHDFDAFDCGEAMLNRYLREQAGQDMRRHYAALFVAVDKSGGVNGFYTLSSTSIALDMLPEKIRKRLPKYPHVPGIRLGRLAVDVSMQRQRIGTELIANAALRSLNNVAAWAVMVVDAKNERAVAFYGKIGFAKLADDERHLFIMRSKLTDFIANA
jgi:ribosomal protein S18 acetylase RimI-like enzyme